MENDNNDELNPSGVKHEAMIRLLLQKNLSSKKISISANCPIMTLIMNRKQEVGSCASKSEIESLQTELENLLTDAGLRYKNLQALLSPKNSGPPKTSKLQSSSKSATNPTHEIPFYHLSKPISFTDIEKRAKFLKEAKEASIPIDKTRNEQLERFWSAVEEYVGMIPSDQGHK